MEAICVPWPSSSRGDREEAARTLSAPKPSTNHRAPTSLASQPPASQSAPPTQSPWNARGARPSPGTGAKSGLSGEIPESTMPITVPAPPRLAPGPAGTPGGPALPASRRTEFFSTRATPGSAASSAACAAVSRTATPLSAVVQR
jgi:hypothetical protein